MLKWLGEEKYCRDKQVKTYYWASKLTDKTGICWRAETKGLFFLQHSLSSATSVFWESGTWLSSWVLREAARTEGGWPKLPAAAGGEGALHPCYCCLSFPWSLAGYTSSGRGSGNSFFFFFQLECICFCPYRDLYRPLLTVQLSAVSETQLCSAGYFFLLFHRDRKIHPESTGLHLNWEFKWFWICLVRQPPTLKDSCYLLYRLLSQRVPEQISFFLAFIMASSMLLVLHIFGVCKYLQWYLGKYVCPYTL